MRTSARVIAGATIFVVLAAVQIGAAHAQFAKTDLTGTWSSFVRYDNPLANDPGYLFGTIEVDASGSVTGGSHTDETGVTLPHTGGSISIDPSGDVGGSITNASWVDAFANHQLDESANLLVGVDTDPNGYVGLDFAIKHTGSFSTADLEGRWRYIGLWDDPAPSPNQPGWDHFQIEIDDQGIVTSTAGFDSQGLGMTLDGTEFTIDAAGLVGSADYAEAKLKMMPNKNVILGVLRDNDGFVSSMALIRDLGNFSIVDLEGRWRYYTIWDGTNTNRPNWAYGIIDLDATGDVLEGTFELPGFSAVAVGGAFGVSLGGAVNGTLDLGSSGLLSFKDIQLNEDAKMGVGGYSNGTNRVLTVMVVPEPARVAMVIPGVLALGAMSVARRRRDQRTDC